MRKIYTPNYTELKLIVLDFVHTSQATGHSSLHKSVQRVRVDFSGLA